MRFVILSTVLLITSVLACSTADDPRPRQHEAALALAERPVARVWRGRTPAARGDEYMRYLYDAGIRKIRATKGNLGAQVFRRRAGDAEEFVVISYWANRDVIRGFAGDDIEKTHHLPRDPEFLLELEPRVVHYDVVVNEPGGAFRLPAAAVP